MAHASFGVAGSVRLSCSLRLPLGATHCQPMDWSGNWYGQMGFILISVTQGRQRLISTLIAAVHYLYMREYWVSIKQTPIGYRYIDWSLTVPLQTTNFLYILRTMKPDLGAGLFGRLLLGTIVMLAFDYLGKQYIDNPWTGLCTWNCQWGCRVVRALCQ